MIDIKKFRKDRNISQIELCEVLNVKQPYISAIENGKRPLSEEKFSLLYKQYGDVIMDYKTTERPIIITSQASNENAIPISSADIKEGDYGGALVYDIDATCGTDNREIFFTQENIIGSVNLPGVNKSSQIIRANGDSMEPKICDGNMIVIREIKNWQDIFYGQMYLVLLDEYRMIKYIRRYEPDEEHYILLRSENTKYDDIKLRKDKIRKLFIVENILSVKTQL